MSRKSKQSVNKNVMFAEAFTTTTLFAVIVAVSNALVGLFTYMLAVHNSRHDKKAQKEQKIEEAKKVVDDACDNGNLSDLIDAAKQIGEARK